MVIINSQTAFVARHIVRHVLVSLIEFDAQLALEGESSTSLIGLADYVRRLCQTKVSSTSFDIEKKPLQLIPPHPSLQSHVELSLRGYRWSPT